jgi:hypothetical protein
MINLLKFASGKDGKKDGHRSCNTYTAAVEPMQKKLGGRLLWMGAVSEVFIGLGEDHWDALRLVEYP